MFFICFGVDDCSPMGPQGAKSLAAAAAAAAAATADPKVEDSEPKKLQGFEKRRGSSVSMYSTSSSGKKEFTLGEKTRQG